MQHTADTATHCNTLQMLQHTATINHESPQPDFSVEMALLVWGMALMMQHTADTATHCNTLQHTTDAATHFNNQE